MDLTKQCRWLAARAELEITEHGDYCWRILECPLCGGVHTHGGIDLDGDPRASLGHRTQHCATNPMPLGKDTPLGKAAEILNVDVGGYILTDADPDLSAELIASLEVHDDDVFEGIVLKEIGV